MTGRTGGAHPSGRGDTRSLNLAVAAGIGAAADRVGSNGDTYFLAKKYVSPAEHGAKPRRDIHESNALDFFRDQPSAGHCRIGF